MIVYKLINQTVINEYHDIIPSFIVLLNQEIVEQFHILKFAV